MMSSGLPPSPLSEYITMNDCLAPTQQAIKFQVPDQLSKAFLPSCAGYRRRLDCHMPTTINISFEQLQLKKTESHITAMIFPP